MKTINSIARQPIFDKSLSVYGYELLFRGEALDTEGLFDHDYATTSVLYAGLFAVGLDKLTHGKKAFVNFSNGLLTSGLMQKLSNPQITIEILEHIKADAGILQVCEELKKAGYQIALDDFSPDLSLNSLVPLADIIKVDLLACSEKTSKEIPLRFAGENRLFLAEKVETYEQYVQALGWGYSLFQGYFFCRPQRIDTREIRGNKLVCFQLLRAMQDPTITMEKLEQIVQQDLFLSFAIIKYINSAAVGFRNKVQSLKQALTLLGLNKIREFSTILLLKRLGDDKPDELIVHSLIRSRFTEMLARRVGLSERAGEAFLVGMLSLIDALLDKPIQGIIEDLNLEDDIAAALQNRPGPLTFLLEAIVSYEQADWHRHDECIRLLPINGEVIQEIYFEAVSWGEDIFGQCE
jgi:EAL and modified HD-GYP domain-containing signal transduction protein